MVREELVQKKARMEQKVSDLAQKLGIARNEVVAAQVGLLFDRKSINFEA